MPKGTAIAYATAGGLIAFSGIKGASLADTAKAVLSGNLNPPSTESISGGTSPATGDTGASSNTAKENQDLAQSIADQMGLSSWTIGQTWSDWVSLWNQESGWSATADNKTSGAYGIAQALPSSKYPPAGQAPPVGISDPRTQITWGIGYIQGRYGTPTMAWAHEVANNWY